jgi:hypothetical protein
MRITKAYLAGLGTTGVLIASVLTVMVIGTGLVGFEGHEFGGGGSPLERVVVGDGAHAKRAKSRSRRTDAGGGRLVAGAERHRPASRQQVAERTREAGGRRDAAGRRASRRRAHGHGGTPVRADVLSGGAAAGRRSGGGTGKPPGRSGGGMPMPTPIERAPEDLQDALPPGLRR